MHISVAMARPPTRQQAAAEASACLEAEFFRALCEPVRIQLLSRLIELGRADVAEIAKGFDQDRSVISRHLRTLRDAGILIAEKDGRHVFYELDGPGVVERLENLTQMMRRVVPFCCPGR